MYRLRARCHSFVGDAIRDRSCHNAVAILEYSYLVSLWKVTTDFADGTEVVSADSPSTSFVSDPCNPWLIAFVRLSGFGTPEELYEPAGKSQVAVRLEGEHLEAVRAAPRGDHGHD